MKTPNARKPDRPMKAGTVKRKSHVKATAGVNQDLVRDLEESGYIAQYYADIFAEIDLGKDLENYTVRCPFHEDNTPSLSVNVTNGLYNCFSCGAKGSIVQFRMEQEAMTDMEAIHAFAEELKDFQPNGNGKSRRATKPQVKKRTSATAADIDRWQKNLLDDSSFQPVLETLRQRGLTDEVIRRFNLGGDTDNFDSGKASGMCVVIPIYAEDGTTPLTIKKILYSNSTKSIRTDGSTKVLFNSHALRERTAETVFITEGELDAIRLAQEGLLAVSSAGGASCWDDTWARHFDGMDAVVVYDSDSAGRDGAKKVVWSLQGKAKSIRDVDLFPGKATSEQKDVTDLFRLGNTLRDFLMKVDGTSVVTGHQESVPDLFELMEEFAAKAKGQRHLNEVVGEMIFNWVLDHGGKFFRDRTHNVHLVMEGRTMSVDESDKSFLGYLFKIARLTSADTKGKVIIKTLQALGIYRGELVSSSRAVFLDPKTWTIFLHLCNEIEDIVSINPVGIRKIPNGTNPHGVLLSKSSMMMPLEFVTTDGSTSKAMLLRIEELVLKHLACRENDRWLVLMWVLGFPFKDLVLTRPLMRFEGSSLAGKSTAVELITRLIYGADQKSVATPAALFSEGSINPLVFIDNMERQNMYREVRDFLLTSATGIIKRKRKHGTDTEVITETPHCLVCMTGIENLFGEELINRCLLVDFDKTRYGSNLTGSIFQQIVDERPRLMGGVFYLYSQVLKLLQEGKLEEHEAKLRNDYPQHSKDRANEYLALMSLLMDVWFKITGRETSALEVVREWVTSQNTSSEETSVESNLVVQYMDCLASRVWRHKMDAESSWDYPVGLIHLDKEYRMKFTCFSYQLHQTFMMMMRGLSPGYEFRDAKQLGVRIADSIKALNAAGWKVKKYCRKKGRALWEFEYKLQFPSGTTSEESQ